MNIGVILGYVFIILSIITQSYMIFVMLIVTKGINVMRRMEEAQLVEVKETNVILEAWHEEVLQQRNVASS
jgi:hypothetical protein